MRDMIKTMKSITENTNMNELKRGWTYYKEPVWLNKLLCKLKIKHNWLLISFDVKTGIGKYECVYCNKIKRKNG